MARLAGKLNLINLKLNINFFISVWPKLFVGPIKYNYLLTYQYFGQTLKNKENLCLITCFIGKSTYLGEFCSPFYVFSWRNELLFCLPAFSRCHLNSDHTRSSELMHVNIWIILYCLCFTAPIQGFPELSMHCVNDRAYISLADFYTFCNVKSESRRSVTVDKFLTARGLTVADHKVC